MRVLLDVDPCRDLEVAVHDPDATLGDLLVAAGVWPVADEGRAGACWWVDGVRATADRRLADLPLADGAVISPRPVAPIPRHAVDDQPCRAVGAALATVVAGPGSGAVHPVQTGRPLVVGRAGDADLVLASTTVSGRHLSVTAVGDRVVVEDLGSRNGSWIDGVALVPGARDPVPMPVVVRAGACVLRLTRPVGCDTPTGPFEHTSEGTRLVHRPPRPTPPPAPPAVDPPMPPPDATRRRALRWMAVLVPLVMGGAMVVVTGNVRFAVFAVMSPVMALGAWWSDRRSSRREQGAMSAAWDDELRRFDDDLRTARAQWMAREEDVVTNLGEIVRRALEPSVRVWERRPDHADAFAIRIGSGPRSPRLVREDDVGSSSRPMGAADTTRDTVRRLVAVASGIPDAPVTLSLARHPIVGIVGDREAVLAVARSCVLQLAVLHGPADLALALVTGRDQASDWAWTRWLPHGHEVDTTSVGVAAVAAASRLLASRTRATDGEGPTAALVVDDPALVRSGHGGLRRLLRPGGRAVALVLATDVERLPAACQVVVELDAAGTTSRLWESETGRRQEVLPAQLSLGTARHAARALAHLSDPEGVVRDDLPSRVRLGDLLGDRQADDTQRRLGGPTRSGRRLAAPLGIGAHGKVWIDLVRDGPHALVGGTTGSGKSELLRTLVVGLADRHTTDEVVFVLVDYKGGAAFRACEDLPHVVGLVTDLDGGLGVRALTSLDAEVRHREQVLARAGADDLPDLVARGAPGGGLPRLVVVVDEFATLVAEVPGFVEALVGIAQRGRSLGVHLVLATQRPRGAVDADVRANTDLRIALRVLDESDSHDVVDQPHAASIPRDRPGRAWVRRGHDDLVEVQTAWATGPVPTHVAPVVVREAGTTVVPDPPTSTGDATELDELVRRACVRHDTSGRPHPRRPWLPMLPDDLSLPELVPLPEARASTSDGDRLVTPAIRLGTTDRPDRQRRDPLVWDPGRENLVALGRIGSGTTTTLRTTVVSAARIQTPDHLHVYAIAGAGDGLRDLDSLPHTGCVLRADQADEQCLLLAWLAGEVHARVAQDRASLALRPRIMVVVDDLAGFLAAHDDRVDVPMRDDLAIVAHDGPRVGIAMVAATDRLSGVPGRLRQAFGRTLVHGAVDERDRAQLGLQATDLADAVPGRVVDTRTGLVAQVARLPEGVSAIEAGVATAGPSARLRPRAIRGLPDVVDLDGLPPAVQEGGRLVLPVGMSRIGGPSAIVVHPGDHVTVAGRGGSGRTTALRVLSAQVRAAHPTAVQVALCDPDRSRLHGWSCLDASGSADGLRRVLQAGITGEDPWFVLVDDVRWCGDDDLLAALATARPDLHLVVAGRPGDLRGGFGTWHRDLRASGTGVLLQPEPATDGDLLGIRLPGLGHTARRPGRGFVVHDGTADLAQLAGPPQHPPAGSLAA